MDLPHESAPTYSKGARGGSQPNPVAPGTDDAMPEFPRPILDALECGDPLSEEQLRLMIKMEAEALGLSVEDALSKARSDELPYTPIGMNLRSLVWLLDRESPPAS